MSPDRKPTEPTANAAERRDTAGSDVPPWRVEKPTGPAAGPANNRPRWRFLVFGIIVALSLNYVLYRQVPGDHKRVGVPYSFFRTEADSGNVAKVSSKGDTIEGEFRKNVKVPGGKVVTHLFKTERPAFADDSVLEVLLAKGATVDAKPKGGGSLIGTLLFGFGPALLIIGMFILMARRASGGMGGMGGIGKSKAKRYDASQQRTTFADVAGIEDAMEELVEVVDFLKEPERYRRLGGMIPKGVLLSGLPGTGKTLLARAVAGEADVPFFSLSASEFVEMIVGVGASRVRDLFKQAKEAAPAIIFIDELDAIGRTRGAGPMMGGHDEREQTLNQILTEMDGFAGNEGVIVLAATNRPEILDAALLRPGRFDRRVVVSPPDQEGRLKILEVHTRAVAVDETVDLRAMAASTPGMVGADLRNLVNEAALLAARRRHDKVDLSDFTDALEKIVLGSERRIMLTEDDRRRTAYHEAGHALLGMLIPGADPVRKVSIIPRGRALGVTFQSPDADRYGYSAEFLHGRLAGMMGGRAAEQLVYADVTTGAQSDLEQATIVARQMVAHWGMSEAMGLMALPSTDQGGFFGSPDAPSEETRRLVDDEVRRLTSEAYDRALELLTGERERLDALAAALLANETLDETDAYRAAGLPAQRQAAV